MFEDRLKSRRKRATRDENKDLEKIIMEKIVAASLESDRLRGLLNEHETEERPAEEDQGGDIDNAHFEDSGLRQDEERTGSSIEEEEEEHDLIDELAIVLELEEE